MHNKFMLRLAAGLISMAGCTSSNLFERGGKDGASGSGGGTSDAPLTEAPSATFEALAPTSYVNKVKTILTGLPATDAEVVAVSKDGKALRGLVTTWLATPSSRQIQQDFLANAFQQSLVTKEMFVGNVGDLKHGPTDELVANFRQSFAKTAMQIMDDGQPFTQVANTQRFMMTTAMLSWLALNDVSWADDDMKVTNRLVTANPNWGFSLTGTQTIPLSTSADPKSPQYSVFTISDLSKIWSASGNNNQARCAATDPITPAMFNAQYGTTGTAAGLYAALSGQQFSYKLGNITCTSAGTSTPYLEAKDYSDWRMVTVKLADPAEMPIAFWDVPTLRAADTLSLTLPQVGFFTTPAFLGQWPTNTSNQARLTANQTLITGLGFQVDGSDQLAMTSPTAVDTEHAGDPACFTCHQTLDPFRQFFRQSFSLYFGMQTKTDQTALPATFAFRGVTQNGKGVIDLGNIIANHPSFALGWTTRLCAWANSATCQADDLEVQRIAKVFQASNYSFSTLMQEMFTSPLTTYAAPTRTTNAVETTTIARQAQLCALLNARLGQTDLCGHALTVAPDPGSIPGLAANLASDTYTRGQTTPEYVTQSDPFGRNTLESLCLLTAQSVVDSGASAFVTSNDAPAAIQKIVSNLLGLTAANASTGEVTNVLTTHYKDAVAAGQSPTTALQSTFVLGCVSPFVASIGI